MSATRDQLAFAAEFLLFLTALAGVAVVALRSELLVRRGRLRWPLVAGMLAVGAAAFLHGSLLVTDAGAPAIVVPRIAGLVVIAIVTHVVAARTAAAVLLAAEVLSVVTEPPTAGNVVRGAGALLLGAALLVVTRRSIPARVVAGAAGTVLLIVLAVSVTLSTLVVDNVQNEVLRRTRARAAAEATDAESAPDAVRVRATGVAQLLVERATADKRAGQLLVALATDPGGAEARSAAGQLAAGLDGLGRRPDLFAVGGLLAFVTPTEEVVAGPGVPAAGSARAQLAFLDVVADAMSTREAQSAPDVLGGSLLAVAAAPVTFTTAQGPQFTGVVVTADALDDAYLQSAVRDDLDLSLAIVTRDGVTARAGRQPPVGLLRSVARAALRAGAPVNRTAAERFVTAAPVVRGSRPLAVVVASAPSRLATDTQKSLFRTLFIVALLATLLAVVLAALVGNRIGRGLRRLTSTAEGIEAGDLAARAGVTQPDELGVLGAAFDRMAASLQAAALDEALLRGRLEAVIGGMGEALVAVDPAGVITDFNPAAAQLFGTPAAAADLAARLAGTTSAWSEEAEVRHADGATVPVVVTAAPLGDQGGAVAVLRDVRREREVDRMKTEFLSNISHEMKTPLTPIKGYAQMLATRDVPKARARAFAQEIVSGATQLERVITQLVNFSSMAAGRLEAAPENVRTRLLVDDAVARWSGRAAKVQRRVARGTPDLHVDRRLLDLALDELLDNAVKYSPDGGRIRLTAEPDGRRYVLLRVADRGVGIPPDRLEAIFTEFEQGDGSSTRSFGGLGLGLSLVQHVAEVHGGELNCESAPGRGTTFTLRVPAAP